jgi:hypothetical protein
MATRIIRQASFALALAASMSFMQTAHAASTYDLVKEFSIKSNPNGVWTYMDSAPLAYNHKSYEGVSGLENWSNDVAYPNTVTIAKNKTGQTASLDNGSVMLPPDYLLVDAESAGPYGAVIQFEAPTAGLYTVKGSFLGLAHPEAGNNLVLIELNSLTGGGELFQATVRSGREKKFNFTVTMAVGDHLYFQESRTLSKKKLNDVGLTAKITGP